MSARFWASELHVHDRRTGRTVCGCYTIGWAEMIADGLNMIVDQVAPWSPGAAHVDILDGEVIDDDSEQKAIGWHDEPLSSL